LLPLVVNKDVHMRGAVTNWPNSW